MTNDKMLAVGSDIKPYTIQIKCDKITLFEKSLDIEIDVSDKVDKFEKIIVNGVEFVRVKSNGE